VGKQGGKKLLPALICLLVLLALAAAGCSSASSSAGLTEPWFDMTGRYVSTTELGDLGIVTLDLERYEDTEIFSAYLTGSAVPDLEPGRGAGTLGDSHLIIDFDIGIRSDYYFEGMVAHTDGVVESISGQFIFPDETGVMPVTFVAI
jgi:hypothetical protein